MHGHRLMTGSQSTSTRSTEAEAPGRFSALLDIDRRWSARLRIAEKPGLARTLAILLAHSGDSWFWGAALATVWWTGTNLWKWRTSVMFLAIAATAVVVMALKVAVRRRRPAGEWGKVYRSTDPHSFPSGHAARMMMLGVVALHVGPPWLAAALALWAPLVALARVAMGVHYLSDVVGGAVLGLLMGGLTALFF
jgi:undecaprenyl-diphosphatase